jgi:hypothetical protein
MLHESTPVFLYNTRHSCHILMKFKFSRQVLEKHNIKLHKNPSSGSQIVPYGRKDGQT